MQYVTVYLTFYRVGVEQSLSAIDKLSKDIDWLNEFKAFIEKIDIPHKRKQAVLAAIARYRSPASLIYNKKTISK